MIRLSIVIPFYNVEKYIAACLDSVYNQDIPEEEYEVICVNDASPDGSRNIVFEYQKKHSNLILIEHEVNKKLGAARNTGRRIARGKYLWNVDSDDMIAPNCLRTIVSLCDSYKLDVLLFSCHYLCDGTIRVKETKPWIDNRQVLEGLSFWKQQVLHHQKEISPVWTQVYRRDYLNENNIWSPNINMGEDVPYSYETILKATRLLAINNPFYIYRKNDFSLTNTIARTPSPTTLFENCFVCAAQMSRLLRQIPSKESAVSLSIKNTTRHIILRCSIFYNLLSQSDKNDFLFHCRQAFWRNLFVFRILNRKQLYQYLAFLLNGKLFFEA